MDCLAKHRRTLMAADDKFDFLNTRPIPAFVLESAQGIEALTCGLRCKALLYIDGGG